MIADPIEKGGKQMKQLQKLTAVLLSMLLILSAFLPAFAAQNEPLARGDAAQLILDAADDYRAGLTLGDIIKGYEDGELRESAPVTLVEAATMLSRAFGTLPTPVGDDLRTVLSRSICSSQ